MINKKQFLKEVGHFRYLMSDADFWKSESQKDTAIKALTVTYLNCEHEDESSLETAACILLATIDEFHRREFHILACKK